MVRRRGWNATCGGLAAASLLVLAGCGGGSQPAPPPPPPPALGLTVSAAQATVFPGGAATTLTATVTRPSGDTGAVSLTITGLPPGVTAQTTSPGAGASGTVRLTAAATAAAGDSAVTLTASDPASESALATVKLTVGVVVTVAAPSGASYNTFLTTSFQYLGGKGFFAADANAPTLLAALDPQHVRGQLLSGGSPETAPDVWNFATLDANLQPLLKVGDDSPEFQVGQGPAFMYDAGGNLLDQTFKQFGTYAQQLVEYYNAGGFSDGGQTYKSPSGVPITWWGIYNEPDINHLTAAQYTQLYNTVVPMMLAADANIKPVAGELAYQRGQDDAYMTSFLSGVTAPMSALALHFYGACSLPSEVGDQQLFDEVAGGASSFAGTVTVARQLLDADGFTSVPVWITENNVNADFDDGGVDACEKKPWVADTRGTDAYFAAWRPYVFSQLVKAGAGALYHWEFADGDVFSEVDSGSGACYLSYWVDEWLGRELSVPAGESYALPAASSSDGTVEAMAAEHPDGTVVVMVADHAVANAGDVNGPGSPRTVSIDLSAWPAFSSAQWVVLDAGTNISQGPQPTAATPAAQMSVTLPGYGFALLILKP